MKKAKKIFTTTVIGTVVAILTLTTGLSWAQNPPTMKMTTEIPPGITTPDDIETRIGTLTFFDGVPIGETTDKVYNFLDFQHAYQAFMSGIQIASVDAIRKGILELGPANTNAVIYEELMDSTSLFLTANTTSVYMFSWLQLEDEPMVIETPPDVLGIIDDHWFKYVADFGRLGPDQGQGGKFLILPPGYEGEVPEGYYVARTNTYGNWILWRGFQVDGSTKTAVDATKNNFRIYPLSQKDNPPTMSFVNASGKLVNTIHRMDDKIFDEINEVVQSEPSEGESPEILGILASIGIKKGQEFNPDARMREIFTKAANAGSVTVKTIMSKPRDEMFYFYPGESNWLNPFPGGSYEWVNEGAKLLDARAGFHYYATGITPAMAKEIIGKGSKYAYTYLDADGNPLDGSKTYKVNVPPNVPAKDFWSFTIYDNQTRSMLQTDERFPGIDDNRPGIVQNSDGSYDIYFGPEAPQGQENNWVQTIPGRGWNTIFRLYGPLEPWFEKTWRPGEIELIE
ncbi:DUF1254 domain-containing protein [Xenococcus sp. PCC 7305]|uniref:DUF1254 domain-containing protein n=1 Tax=Xenococcus sp. PCC 7305 TaxID=102125 RepID=UPI00059275A8|nr:DUF1254 domain-containing protein [Xenococcus sp. PCC 7305]